jgi:hypothetical protein
MRPDSPFYSHYFEVLSQSPLFTDLDERILQDMLLSCQRETWLKNPPAMNSRLTFRWFYFPSS